mmetsp:Transcript_126421/g.236303  ORF Transcript_126421/g.236303 Transcript_126421/m.236303 type:complete len:325 (-) Transcript_126421:33-1007(-)
MAAQQAFNVVKQIEALADGPATPELRECLGQLVSSLQFFLDHPDSRVRLGSARALLKLAKGFSEDFAQKDLSKAKDALAKAQSSEESEDKELEGLLAECLDMESRRPDARKEPELYADASTPGEAPVAASEAPVAAKSSEDEVAEVVLQVGADTDGATKAKILEKVISISGVVSVTFELENVIVRARTQSIANDPTFAQDIKSVIQTQGLDCSSKDDGPPGPAVLDDDDDDAEPAYLDDEDGAVEEITPAGMPGSSSGVGGAGGAAPQWSFFSQSNWMTGRRVQEFDEDPTIAARLAKAKKRMEERRKEEESRLGRLSSWMGWR